MFFLTKIENARMNVPEPEYLEAKASEEITDGEALVLTAGKLTQCGASVKPQFIAGANLSASATDRIIPVFRVTPDQVYAAPVSSVSGITVGSKYNIDADALGVTATTGGAATVVSLNGAEKAGDPILVRFA